MAFDPDAFLDDLGVPSAPRFDPDSLLDAIGVPALQKRKKPATLAALDDDGPNSSPPMDRPGDPDYVPGRLHVGNIDLSRRPTVHNADGTISTVRSISASFGHGEVLLPTVSDDGRILSSADAIDTYRKTGRHLGIFESPDAATAYAQRLHQDQDRLYSGHRDMSQLGAGLRAAGALPATTAAPETSPLYNLLGLDVAKDTLAGAGRTAVNTVKAIPEELNRGTSGVESSLGGLARATGRLLQARPPGASDAGLLGLGPALRAPGRFVERLGGEVEDIGGRQAELADVALQGNPEADSIISRAVQGLPMMAGLAATGGGTLAATAGMGLLGAGGGLKQAEEAGATPEQAWTAAGLQGGADALLGQIGSVPAIRGLLHGVPVNSPAEAVLALAKQGGSGAIQAIGMDLAHGIARHLTYSKDYGLDAGEFAKNAAAQALLQGVLEAPGIEIGGQGEKPPIADRYTPGTPEGALKVTPGPPVVAPFRGTWPEFLLSRDMDRSDFAVLTGGGKKALRAEYDAALDAHREQAATAREAARPSKVGILDQREPVHPAVEAAVNAALPLSDNLPRMSNASNVGEPPVSSTVPASTFPSEVFGRLVEGKPLRLAKTDLERDVGQAARGLWPTGLLKGPADVQLLHDALAGGGDLDAAVTALARQAPQKAERIAPPTASPEISRDLQGSPGITGTAVTDSGTELPFRYGLVNAPDLVTSHTRLGDGSLQPNPAFPAELQPRDRSRAASRLQVDRMVNSLDPERLAESRLASQGAPLVGPDGAVESGNARSLAIGAAYQGGPQAAGYRLWLEQNAARFGLDPAHVRSLDQPVLVRHRQDVPGLDRVRLAQEANQSDVAIMSRSERAAVDAQALTPELLGQYTPNGSGDLTSPSNRSFALGFLQRTTSPAELGAVVDPRGQLSQEGQSRLHAALLAGAYQDPGLVSRMSEATDDNTRSLSRALATEAPAFIGLRQGAESGSVHPGLDLGPDIAAAANKLSELRASGRRVPEYLAQGGLFGHELTPESQRLLTLFDEFKRTPSRIAETLHRYVELATATGDPRQQSLIPQKPPSKADLLERAASTWNQAGGLLPFEEPSVARHAELAAVVADHLAATLPPEHVASFTPGDSGAVESPANATAVLVTTKEAPVIGFATSPGTSYDVTGATTTRTIELPHLVGRSARAVPSERTVYVRPKDALLVGAHAALDRASLPRLSLTQDSIQRLSSPGGRGEGTDGPPIRFETAPRVGLAPIEVFGNGAFRAGEPITEVRTASPEVTAEGTKRWLLGSALGDQDLAQRLSSSADRRLAGLADPLASVAPSLADAPPELRGYLRQAVDAYAATREAGGIGWEVSRLGRLLGSDAPEEVHHIASFLADNAHHPESVALYLHRVAELHQQSGGEAGGEGQLSLSQLLEMASDRDQRQAAGSVIPLESSVPISKGVIYSPGERGSIDLRGPRFGEAAPIRRWFTRDGKFAAMGDDLATRTKNLVNEKDFRVKATSGKVVANVRDFGSALDEQMLILKHADSAPPGAPFGPDATREEVLKYVRAGMQGENDLSAVTPALQDAAGALRAHLDAQSLAYATRPDLPATLRQVISDNVGSYLPRTFERITDPKGWTSRLKNDPNQAWRVEDAAKWAQEQHPDWTPEEAQGYAWKLLMDDPQAAYAIAKGAAAQKAGIGTESRGNLKARLNLPQELDNLLGLHSDPSRSYQIGAMRAARDLATYDLHSKVAAMGSADPARPDGLTPDGQRPIFVDRPTPDLPVRIGGKGPLAEKYTSEQVAASMRATSTTSNQHTGFMRLYLLANGAIKTGKIALNFPMGVARNMLTWPSLLLAGGHWVNAFPVKYAYETVKALPQSIEANLGTREGGVLKFAKSLAYSLPLANGETVGDHLFPTGQKLADLRAEVYRLQEKGILGQSTSADDLRFYSGQTEEPSAGKRVQKVIRDLGGIWSGEHDLGKHIVFASEVANLKWANPDLPIEEVERMAADRTLATTPSRSEVSEGVRAIRASPGISPFPTFAAERYRNFKNNAKIAMEDLGSTNPRQKVLGASRAAGLLTSLALAGGGASLMLQKLWDTGKEHADALREFLPEYASTHQIAVADRQGGKVRYADISPQMPLTGVTDPAMALLRGIHDGSTRDGLVDAAEEVARPFFDPEFAAKAGIDVMRNREFRGNPADAVLNMAREHPRAITQRPIYLEGGPPGLAAKQIGKYLWHNAGPAAGLEAERFARANDLLPNTNSRGKRYTNQDEVAALGGVRFNTIDMNAALTGVGYELRDALTESKRHFTSERSSSQNDPKTVLDARAAANDRWKNAFEIGMKKVAAARQLGIADYAIRQNLHISGVPPLVIGQLMAGRYSALPLRMPYRVPVDYAGAGVAPSGEE